jgi:hypothetical protein
MGRGCRRPIRFAGLERERVNAALLHTGSLSATFRPAAPARRGALVDERRVVERRRRGRTDDHARPWSRRSPRALRGGTSSFAAAAVSREVVLPSRTWLPTNHGSRPSIRFAGVEIERITGSSHRRAHRHLPLRFARCAISPSTPLSRSSIPVISALTDNAPSHRPAHHHLPLRCARA